MSWCPIDCSEGSLDRTVEIVSQIFEEVFAIFKNSKYHHLGADEVYEDPSLRVRPARQIDRPYQSLVPVEFSVQ